MDGHIARGAAAEGLGAGATVPGDDALAGAVRDSCALLDGPPSVVIAFPSGGAPDSGQLRTVAGEVGAPIVGLSGNGSIGREGAIERGCSALALSSELAVGIGVEQSAGKDLRAAARRACGIALDSVDESLERILLLRLDTRTGDQAEAVAGAYEAAGPDVPIAGGAGGGPEPFQIARDEALSGGVVAVALGSSRPIGISQVHGCRPVGTPAIVTHSSGRLIHELNGRPAANVFLEETGFGEESMSDSDFEALAVTHPLAQPELNGSERIRHVMGRQGASLVCATRVPENAAVLFTRETPENVVATAGQGVSEALAGLRGERARAALVFDCAGRKRAAAGSLSHEVNGILSAFSGEPPPLAGLFTHGEIARIRGAKGDRNHALVVVAFA
jgi:hypothetical protein